MLKIGQRIRTASGRILRVVEGPLGGTAGGEGAAFKAEEKAGAPPSIVKVFLDPALRTERLRRTRWLVAQKLDRVCPAIYAPVDVVESPDAFGYATRFAPGMDFEQFVAGGTPPPLPAAIQTGVVLAHAVDELHRRAIAHGDLHFRNVRLHRAGDLVRVGLIDLDAFAAPGFPSTAFGCEFYWAPEQRVAVETGQPFPVNIETERFALAVLLHELLLWNHPAGGCGGDAGAMAAVSGKFWAFDPIHRVAAADAGLPVGVLNARLLLLFRRSFARPLAERPSAAEWREALLAALKSTWVCERCGGAAVIDDAKVSCPMCGEDYPRLSLVLAAGVEVALRDGSTELGRADFGGAATISSRHAVVRRRGPAYRLESLGRNGTFQWDRSGSKWVRLPDRKEVPVAPGDRLRFADVEAKLMVAS
ncbi:MAG: FHA domain-containing protein [Myxococcota bacterium]|nr:FHA domain-containing protein [Myxococcota bacterium]